MDTRALLNSIHVKKVEKLILEYRFKNSDNLTLKHYQGVPVLPMTSIITVI